MAQDSSPLGIIWAWRETQVRWWQGQHTFCIAYLPLPHRDNIPDSLNSLGAPTEELPVGLLPPLPRPALYLLLTILAEAPPLLRPEASVS